MAKYFVNKRMQEDRVYMPGELLVDPEVNIAVLVQRGFLTLVPDDFTGYEDNSPQAVAVASEPAAGSSTDDNSGASATGAVTLEGLLEMTRAELNEMAETVSVPDPAALPNKQAVAEAILAAAKAEDEDEDDQQEEPGS